MKYTERIYSESEIKLIKEIFDMYIKQISDEDLEKLVFECKEMFLEHQKSLKEIERLKNIINKGIEAINVYQNEKTLSVGYQDLKRIRGILRGNEFDLERFEEYLQELKGSE